MSLAELLKSRAREGGLALSEGIGKKNKVKDRRSPKALSGYFKDSTTSNPIPSEEEKIETSFYSGKEPDEDLYFLTYSFYIAEPLKFDWFAHRDFYHFLLGDSHFVRNLFTPLDENLLWAAYTKKLGTDLSLNELRRLLFFIGTLSADTPKKFEQRILDWIERNCNAEERSL